jgi:large subunit ribosomal protein L32
MAVPRNRLSNARKNSKRSHHAKKPKHMSACKNCGILKMPHLICQSCGAYGNRIVVQKDKNAG